MKIGFFVLVLLIIFIYGCYNQNYQKLNSDFHEEQKNLKYDEKSKEDFHIEVVNTKEKEDDFNIASCGEKKELFNVLPLDLKDFTNIIPLGNLAPSAHVIPTPHLYFTVRTLNPNEENGVPAQVPVYAPADIIITEVATTESSNKPEFSDYDVVFHVCKEFKAYFDHVKNLNKKIKEAVDKAPNDLCHEYTLQYGKEVGAVDWKFCKKKINVEIKAGEKIGDAGGGFGQRVFDFGAFDFRIKPHVFANPNSWRYKSDMFYVVCGLDYFTSELRDKLKSRLGKNNVLRSSEPICGEVAQDVPGTLQGNWIPKGFGDVGEDNPYIALVHDNLDPLKPVFSIGTFVSKNGIEYGTYYFNVKKSGSINRDFNEVKDNQVYCYEDFKNDRGEEKNIIILVQLVNKNELRIEGQNKRKCNDSWNFINYAEYER